MSNRLTGLAKRRERSVPPIVLAYKTRENQFGGLSQTAVTEISSNEIDIINDTTWRKINLQKNLTSATTRKHCEDA